MSYETQLFALLENLKRDIKTQPLILGSSPTTSGTGGGPPGGIIGHLRQDKVSFDVTEAEDFTIPASGMSLVTNLNRIRYRIAQLEDNPVAVNITVLENGTIVSSGVEQINFVNASVVETVPGSVTVTCSGTGGTGTTTVISGIEYVLNEEPTEDAGTYFTTNTFLPDTMALYYNGLRQGLGDFTVTGDNSFTVGFTVLAGDELRVDYGVNTILYSGEISSGGSGGTDSAAIHDNVAGEIAAITEKTTPVAADKILIEDSEAGNAKKYVQVGSLISALSFTLIPVTKTWVSNRADGIFYYLATAGGIRPFSNPALDNILWNAAFYTATQINNQDERRTAEKATDGGIDGETQCVHTQNTANAWWKADFGSTHKLQPTYIGLVGRTSGGQHPRNFKIQGSDNDTDWTDLLTITAAGPETSAWWSSAISGAAAYRYIRLLQTGVNSSGQNYLTFGEIEFWGTLDNA